MTATITSTTTGTEQAPPVRLEPCAAYRPDLDLACPACEHCGWLEDDHAAPVAHEAAVVAELPPRSKMPERLAS